MLNIPDSIKGLYMTDGRTDIRKNFRVTFPNGELPDITNESIVQETVRFSESIMSQNTFRFGLAEAPQIEFECVGIPNMLGMTIACWHEIETTSLTAAQIAEIQAGTWDGSLVLAADSDLGYEYFRLPLGVFTVESCPRSHGAMAHRQVKATGRAVGANAEALDPVTQWKLAQWYPSKSWGINWDFIAPSIYGPAWEGVAPHYTATAKASAKTTAGSFRATCEIRIPGWKYDAKIFLSTVYAVAQEASRPDDNLTDVIRITRPAGFTKQALGAGLSGRLTQTAFADIATAHSDIDWESATTETGEPLGDEAACVNYLTNEIIAAMDFRPYLAPDPIVVTTYDDEDLYCRFGDNFGGFDEAVNISVPDGVSNAVYVPYGISSFSISLSYRSTPTAAFITETYQCTETTISNVVPQFYTLVSTDTGIGFPDLPLSTTLELKVGNTKYFGYTNSFSFKKLLTSFLELQGRFGKVRRDGVIEIYDLAQGAAEHLTQSDIQELWWDESNIEPVGSVKVKYKIEGSDEEQSAVIAIGPGASTYDMTDSYILTKWATTLSAIRTTLRGRFAQSVTALTWTPMDATVRGLPYVEAGDWVEMETGAEDIPVVGFPYLDREIGGIQSLVDNVSCASGDVTNVEVEDDA